MPLAGNTVVTTDTTIELIKREARAKAIDEFAKSLNERLEEKRKKAASVLVGWAYEDAIEIADQLAEQLKAGGK